MRYWVDTTKTNAHTVSIKLEFEAPWDKPILELPVWTPGSYKVRDYSRHIFSISANVNIDKISKNQWKVDANESEKIIVNYDVYCYDLTVRTSFLDDRYGLLSPASLFFYIIDEERTHNKESSIKLDFTIPDQWEIYTSLHKENGSFLASDYDELVDSPFGLGHQEVLDTLDYSINNADGNAVPCKIVLIGHEGNQDISHFKDQMIKLQQKSIEMFGSLPYDRYLWVLYVVGAGGGGLEHKFSNFSIINRWYFDKEDKMKYAKLMSLEAHEHFHAYNIKRIRPSQLGPFEYQTEVYTKQLWVAEGVTSFYDNIFLPRTGIVDEETYWKVIAKDYNSLQNVEGRKYTSLQSSSFDAWIKLYQSHEGANNLFVSYYLKGGLVTLMLDLEIRKQSNWEYSLDTFYKKMYEAYLEDGKTYDEDNFRKLVEDATGTDLAEFWEKYIEGTEELPFDKYLNDIGMRLVPEESKKPYLGLQLASDKSKVQKVIAESPAMKAGIYSGDKLIAFNKYAVKASNFDNILKKYQPGDEINVHLVRDEIFRTVKLTLGEPAPSQYKIIKDDDVSDLIKNRRDQFFHK